MPQEPSLLGLLAGGGMVLVAVVIVLLWQRGKASLWRFFGLGALGWAVSVALKVAWALPMNKRVVAGIANVVGDTASKPLSWVYVGLLTGVFESGIVYLIVVKSRLRRGRWDEAVAFGIGFGATEAFLVGLASFVGLLVAILSFGHLSTDIQAKIVAATNMSAASMLLPIAERVTALVVHTFACVLIVYAVRSKRMAWFWLSFAFKTAIDAFAMWGIEVFHVKDSITRLAEFNLMIAGFAVVGLVGLRLLRPRFQALTSTAD